MRWLKRITLGALVVVVVVGAGTLTWLTVRAHAPTSGTIQAPGLTAEVVVRRDASGIAHLTASTPADLFFAQGWVHASERMWQMEVWRHISSGRLAELFGPSQLETDRFIRTLGWRRAVERDRDAVSPAHRGDRLAPRGWPSTATRRGSTPGSTPTVARWASRSS